MGCSPLHEPEAEVSFLVVCDYEVILVHKIVRYELHVKATSLKSLCRRHEQQKQSRERSRIYFPLSRGPEAA